MRSRSARATWRSFWPPTRRDHPITGTATFNVQPAVAGAYFKKIQCFCFTQQTLKPGETARMPVIFYVDPAILKDEDAKDVQTITLSYTFYPSDQAPPPSAQEKAIMSGAGQAASSR